VPCRTCRRYFEPVRWNQKDCPKCKGTPARLRAWLDQHQSELFDTPEPQSEKPTIQERFEHWIEANPRTWALIRGYAYDYLEAWLRKKKHKRIGVDVIVGRVRYECSLDDSGEDWAINNSYRSRISRRLIEEDKRFADLFETRALKTE
jgi:hypothetical protein